MKHTKKLSAIILSAVMLTTACSGSTSPDSSTQIKDSDPAASENAGTDDSADSADSSNDTVSASKSVKDVIGDIKVDTKVKFLGWYDLNNSNVADTYKELFGVPEKIPSGYEKIKYRKSSSGSTADEEPFVSIKVSNYSERYFDLAKLIQSDDSPDAFPCESMFPYYSIDHDSNLLFAPVDDIIDFSLAEFAQYEQAQKKTTIGRSNFAPVYDAKLSEYLWYKTSTIKENGLEDPWELYEKDEWTWSKFIEMSEKFTDKEKEKYAIDGYSADIYLWTTTGVPLVGLNDGKLVGNFRNEKILKAMDFVRQFATTQKGYRYPREVVNNWSPSYTEWANGNTLFYNDGSWRYDETWQLYKNKNNWNDDEISFVPFPRCDDEQTYYQSIIINSFMFPKGSKNAEGYKSLIYAGSLANSDKEQKNIARQNAKSEYGWTDRLLDRMDRINDPATFVPVIEFKQICSNPNPLYCGESYIDEMDDWCYMEGQDYKKNLEDEVKGEYVPAIEAYLNDLNSRIS